MLRRRHKKSRQGCHQCKLRHVKCDEGRPVCRLCSLSDRNCSYLCHSSEITSDNHLALESPPSNQSRSLDDSHRRNDHHLLLVDLLATASSCDSPFPKDSTALTARTLASDHAIDLNHMDLLIHFTLNQGMFNLGSGGDKVAPPGISFVLKTSLESPYLMHQLLAYSARHLASLHPERSPFYLQQAVNLQTRAVSLFNAAWREVDQSNCVPILLFSVTLGHHLFADTLTKRIPGGLDVFIPYYVQCLEVQRGVYTVATAAWPLLMDSELEPVLSLSRRFTSRTPVGNHCQQINELVERADGLTLDCRESCRLAVKYLQIGFDAVLAENVEEMENNPYQMIFSWAMLVRPEFISLLAGKSPEALIILGYYALLLHHGKKMWQIGDAGAYMLGMIVDYLDPEWVYWLEYPKTQLSRGGG